MIIHKIDATTSVEIISNANFLHDGYWYEAYLTYDDRRISIGTFTTIDGAITTAIYWHNIEMRKNDTNRVSKQTERNLAYK